MKKHSWDMMLFFPIGGWFLFYNLLMLIPDVKNEAVVSMLAMYLACMLSFACVWYYNKPKKREGKKK